MRMTAGQRTTALIEARAELREAQEELRHAKYEVAKQSAWVAFLENYDPNDDGE